MSREVGKAEDGGREAGVEVRKTSDGFAGPQVRIPALLSADTSHGGDHAGSGDDSVFAIGGTKRYGR